MKKLLILGAGGYGKTIADLAAQLGTYETISYLDDNKTGTNILGKCSDYPKFLGEEMEMYPAFGNNAIRMQWLARLLEAGAVVPTLVHPRAYVSPEASLGVGSMVLPMAVVNTDTTVAMGCIINIGALLDHDCIVEDGAHLAPGAVVKACNRIPAGSKIDSGTVIQTGEFPL